ALGALRRTATGGQRAAVADRGRECALCIEDARADSRAPRPGRTARRFGVSEPCAAPGRVLVLTALHCRAAAPGTGGSWLAAGCASISRWNAKIRPTNHARSGRLGVDVGARRTPLRARRLHVSSHEGPYTHYPLGRGEIMPQLDMTEDDQAFHLQVELPGMDEKDVEVTLRNHTLTIKGEKKEEKEQKDKDVHRRERAYGYFRRSIEIPADVDADKITATYRKGVLTIDLSKTKQAQDQAKRIEVKAA